MKPITEMEESEFLHRCGVLLVLLFLAFAISGCGFERFNMWFVDRFGPRVDPGPTCLGAGCEVKDISPKEWLKACPKGATCKLPYWGPPRNVTNSVADYGQSEWHCGEGWWYAPGIGMSDTWVKDSRKPIVCVERRP